MRHNSTTSYIAPEYLYTYPGFIQCSGISKSRMREARLRGVTPNWRDVGRRKFILGRDAIGYILQLAYEVTTARKELLPSVTDTR